MRKFKYVGTQRQADCFVTNTPVIRRIYNEDYIVGQRTALYYATNINSNLSREWEEIFEPENKPFNLPFEDKVELELTKIKHLLLSKNEKYGNSALEPVRIFSKRGKTDQLLSRIDDKLSRIKNMGIDEQIDEDTVTDLIGYLILLKISKL
jgi:hypothetical protein